MVLQHLPLKYKFWAVNSVAFVTTLMLVLAALWIEQHSLQDQRKQLAGAVLASNNNSVPALPGLKEIPPEPRHNRLTSSNIATPLWKSAEQLDPADAREFYGLWAGQQAGQPYLLGVERIPYMQLLIERAPFYAITVTLLMLLLLVVSQLLISFITGHIVALRDVMLRVQQSGDLTLRAQADSRDEIGSIARAFNAMQASQHDIVRSVRQAAEQLDAGTADLVKVMAQMRANMTSQQGQTDTVAAAANEMSATVQDIARNSSTTRDQSRQADLLAREGHDRVNLVSQTIAGLATSIERCTRHMETLQGHSREISGVVSVIRNIAEQTNLLALNAAIEAARAGESGRGFAVVADEVRALAQRVQISTEEIQRMIEALQSGTSAAVSDMHASAALTHESVEQSQQAGEALGIIAAAVSQIRDGNSEIASAIEQQSQAAEAITESVVQIRDVTETTVRQTSLSAATSEQLASLAHTLSGSVSKLKT
ncbi:methyl-accepting chemotaxis protein [Halopseudomonas laoshanensis]|uniref:methyl-accepting chemotaxis protein n=1 Tax=Halopseudomonas laoshanensis TaxID=2268758 RepID=UPI002934FF89|nr:methyl-accepting chemotaxis protein [Pseudomonas sp. NyZ704]